MAKSVETVKFEVEKALVIKLLPHLTCFRCKNVPDAELPNQEKFKCLSPEAHLLCQVCKEYCVKTKKGKCPCGSNVSTIACPLASSLVDMLPFCCNNKGCQEILSREEMKTHLSRCPFEIITCINLDCEDDMPFKHYLDHLLDCATFPKVKSQVEIILEDEKSYWLPSQVQTNPLNKPLFYFCCEVEDDIQFLCAWIKFLGFKEDAERFTYSLEVNSTRSFKFSGPVKSFFDRREDIMQECDAFMIGFPIAKKICEESGGLALVFNIEIFDKKAEVKHKDDSAMSDD